jgi:hypothetical protein
MAPLSTALDRVPRGAREVEIDQQCVTCGAELRQSFELLTVDQLREQQFIYGPRSKEARVIQQVLQSKIERAAREQDELDAEAEAAKASGMDGTEVHAQLRSAS